MHITAFRQDMNKKKLSWFSIFLLVFSAICFIGGIITFGFFISDRFQAAEPLENIYDISKISFEEGTIVTGTISEAGCTYAYTSSGDSTAYYYLIPVSSKDNNSDQFIGLCLTDPDKQSKIAEIINFSNTYYSTEEKPDSAPSLFITGKIIKMTDDDISQTMSTLNITDRSVICPYIIVEYKLFSPLLSIIILSFSIICLSVSILLIKRNRKTAEVTEEWNQYEASPRRYTDYSASDDLSGTWKSNSSGRRDMDSISGDPNRKY